MDWLVFAQVSTATKLWKFGAVRMALLAVPCAVLLIGLVLSLLEAWRGCFEADRLRAYFSPSAECKHWLIERISGLWY